VFDHLQSVPEDRRPSRVLWPELQILTLEQWRAVTGYEQHSDIAQFVAGGTVSTSINTNSLLFSFRVKQFPWQMQNVPSVEGVDRDFFGQPLPQQNALPGPFQSFHQGDNDLLLVPDSFAGSGSTKTARESGQ
jgi:hypothetical protein